MTKFITISFKIVYLFLPFMIKFKNHNIMCRGVCVYDGD